MAMQMRLGLKSGLVNLQRTEESPDSLKRKLASGLLQKISADYARITVRNYQLHAKDAMHNATGFLSLRPNASKREVWSGLVGKIESDYDLNWVAVYFILLRQTTGIPFRMFDFRQVERWAAKNGVSSK